MDPYHRIKHVTEEELPKCPKCKTGLQRPGVVWFGESLDQDVLMKADNFLNAGPVVRLQGREKLAGKSLLTANKKDMMLVVGTSAQVYPAAGYIDKARQRGARIVTVDPTAEDEENEFRIKPGDFAFGRDAAKALPEMLEPVIGKLQPDGSFKKE